LYQVTISAQNVPLPLPLFPQNFDCTFVVVVAVAVAVVVGQLDS